LRDVLYFPESPVNILGVTQWAIQNDDKEGTYITTKAEYSILVWNFGKSQRRFTHPESMLPKMPINEGSSFCKTFYSAFMSIFPTKSTSRFCLASEMDVTLNDKDKDYLRACSATEHPFQIGNNVQYIGSETPENVAIVESIYDETMQPNFKVERGDGSIITVKQSELSQHADFINAMIDEVCSHEENSHWELATRSSIPRGIKPILAIWSFKRKRFPNGSLNKHKARLCAHGGMQQWGVNYWETYSPVVNWISVQLLLSIAIMNDLPTTAIDFVLAFPQATLGPDELIYMEMPARMDSPGTDRKQYVLKLKKNLYGLKQAGLNWFEYLKSGLTERVFVQSEVDPCVFYRSDAILLVYVDDCIILSKESKVVDSIVKSLATGQDPSDPTKKFSKQYVLTYDGGIKNYLGVEVDARTDGKIELRQKRLIERIIKPVGLEKDVLAASKPTPVVKPLLNKDLEGLPRKYDWNYRSIVGMLGYLQGSTRPDISMATHQCARYNNDPKLSHERAIQRIEKYLLGTQNKGIIFSPNPKQGLECFVDADFSGNWTAVDSEDPENELSNTGYIIFYAGCPIPLFDNKRLGCASTAGAISLLHGLDLSLEGGNFGGQCDDLGIRRIHFHCIGVTGVHVVPYGSQFIDEGVGAEYFNVSLGTLPFISYSVDIVYKHR